MGRCPKIYSKNSTIFIQANTSFACLTEAEWEYACRSAGKEEKYSGGSDIDKVAWYGDNSGDSTHPVGQKMPNGLGIHDMSGNIYEWCKDYIQY